MSIFDYYGEIGWRSALREIAASAVCRVRGHDWSHEEDWESWDEGAAYKTDEYWVCQRCERFSWDRP